MDKSRFNKQIEFLVEIDKMKNIFRQTLIIDKSRRENDAEHSWSIAVMAMILHEYADPDVNLNHVIKMALVHDLIEIYAGDTFAYDESGYKDKSEREIKSADTLFSILPQNQMKEIRDLWEEFEKMETKNAMFAAAIDRLQPLINNHFTDGQTWVANKVMSEKVYKRMGVMRSAMPELWGFVEYVINDAVEKGYLIE